jgi:chemotaxis response regulator CheB
MIDPGGAMRHTGVMTVSIVVCDGDELARRALGQAVQDHQFEVVAEATMAVEAVQLCQVFRADAVLLGNELQGLSGLEVVPELEAAGVRVILVSNDDEALVRARDRGAFFAVARGDLDMIDRALAAIGQASSVDDRRSGIDRRRGVDRRQHDEWAKVVHERRLGIDRRQGERRVDATSDSGRPEVLSA